MCKFEISFVCSWLTGYNAIRRRWGCFARVSSGLKSVDRLLSKAIVDKLVSDTEFQPIMTEFSQHSKDICDVTYCY